jgi:hypothetical protein
MQDRLVIETTMRSPRGNGQRARAYADAESAAAFSKWAAGLDVETRAATPALDELRAFMEDLKSRRGQKGS